MNKILLAFLLYTTITANAQHPSQLLIDSLIRQIPFTTNDTALARLYKNITERYTPINPSQARIYADKGMLLVKKMQWQKGVAVFSAAIASLYSDAGQYDSAMLYNNAALAIHQQARDTFNIASAINNIGVIHQRRSNYIEALNRYVELLSLAEALGNKNLTALAYNNISAVYSFQKDFPKALEYSLKELQIREAENNIASLADAAVNMAVIYLQVPDSAHAASWLQKALLLHQQSGNLMGMATVYMHMATNANNHYRQKLSYALKSVGMWNDINPYHVNAIVVTGNIGVAYFEIARDYPNGYPYADVNIPTRKEDQLKKAITYLNRAIMLSKEVGDVDNEAFFTGNLAEAQALKGDYAHAWFNFRAFQKVQDSIYSQENKNKIAAIESEREVAIRDNEIAFGRTALNNQEKLRWALLAGLGLVVLIAALLFYQSRTRKKMNSRLLTLNSQLDEANKVKVKFLGILSHDLRSPIANLLNFLQLQQRKPGLLSEEKIKEREEKITHAALSLLETMEGMLLWSKGQMEQFKTQVAPIHLPTFFEEIRNVFVLHDHIQFRFEAPANMILHTDVDFLKTIVYNLTANAVDAIGKNDNALITWKGWMENGVACMCINDNGEGFSPGFINNWNNNAITLAGKRGLGMFIVKDLAKIIHCSIQLHAGKNETGNVVLRFEG